MQAAPAQIQAFDSDGRFAIQWGGDGTADGRFTWVAGIATDADGNIYVGDDGDFEGTMRVQKFDGAGRFLATWGNWGPGPGEFLGVQGVAVDGQGNVYVADDGYATYDGSGGVISRILKFDRAGRFLLQWTPPDTARGPYVGIGGIATGKDGSVYVSDPNQHWIQKFDGGGRHLARWGSGGWGTDPGRFNGPAGLAVDDDNFVCVADSGNDRIQKLSGDGQFVAAWGRHGSRAGEFDYVSDVAVDAAGHVYATDWGNDRVQKFKPAFGAVAGSQHVAELASEDVGPRRAPRAVVLPTPREAQRRGQERRTSDR